MLDGEPKGVCREPGPTVRVYPGTSSEDTIAWAALYPLRAALSIVEGQPVSVHSPAKNRLGIGVRLPGRRKPAPGRQRKVACRCLTTIARWTTASRAIGKAWAISDMNL